MPNYEYICSNCKKKFALTMTVSQHEKKKVRCPKCSSTRVTQAIQPFFATTSRKA